MCVCVVAVVVGLVKGLGECNCYSLNPLPLHWTEMAIGQC